MKMRIGEIAELAGVSVRTLQYYDSIGLLKPAETDSNGYRIYDKNSVEQLKKILYYREFNLPLKDISDILAGEKFINEKLTERRLSLADQKRHIEKLISEIDDQLSKPAKIDNWFDKILNDYNYSGFVYRNDSFWVWGKADYENNVPFYLNSRFSAGSITRLFTVFCAFIFEDIGLLNTDDYLNKYIKEFIYGDKVKIHHLITMTSGISDKLLFERFNEVREKEFSSYAEKLSYEMSAMIFYKNVRPSFLKRKSYDEILETINYEPLHFTPGEEFDYREINSEILGIILEQVSGKSIDKIFEEYIFKPLKMNNTSFSGNVDIIGYSVNTPVETNYVCDASKGIITTAEDLGKWCSALIEGKLISEKGRKCFESNIFCNDRSEFGLMEEVYTELSVNIKEGTFYISVRNKFPIPDKKEKIMYYPIKACDDGYVKFEVWTMQSGSEVRVDSIKIFDKNAEELFSLESINIICAQNNGEERHASDFINDGSYYYEMNLSDILKDKFDSKATYIAEVRSQCEEYKYAQLGTVYQHDGEWQSQCFNVFYCYESSYDLFMEALNAVLTFGFGS